MLLALTEQLQFPPTQQALADWNNQPGRTLDEILALLRRSAEGLRQTLEAFPVLYTRLRSRAQATHAEPRP